MFGRLFKRPDNRPPMERAMEKLQQGDSVTAENILRTAIQDAAQRFGKTSPAYASANNDLAMLLFNINQPATAAAALREALTTPIPVDHEGHKDWLSYQMNLAEVLMAAQKLDEAEAVYRENVQGRLAFYGREHAGYAFGLEPLARLLMQQRRVAEALPLQEEVVQNFYHNQHPRIAGAIALRAEALKMANDPTPPFAGLDGLPKEVITAIADAIFQRLGDADPIAYRAVLVELRPFVHERLGAGHIHYQKVLGAIIEHERRLGEAGDITLRLDALREVILLLEARYDAEQYVHALQALGLAQSEAGQTDEAVATYDKAVDHAERSGIPGLLSHALRNYGIFLGEISRRDEAEPILRRAVTAGEQSQKKPGHDKDMQGRAEVALGIFLQHGGRLDEAEPILQAAIRHLPDAHPDALIARSHLQAIENGGSCGCGNMETVLSQAFREFVMARIPKGMVDDVGLTMGEDGVQVHVNVARPLSDQEAEELNRVIQHATEAFRKRIQEDGPYR